MVQGRCIHSFVNGFYQERGERTALTGHPKRYVRVSDAVSLTLQRGDIVSFETVSAEMKDYDITAVFAIYRLCILICYLSILHFRLYIFVYNRLA